MFGVRLLLSIHQYVSQGVRKCVLFSFLSCQGYLLTFPANPDCCPGGDTYGLWDVPQKLQAAVVGLLFLFWTGGAGPDPLSGHISLLTTRVLPNAFLHPDLKIFHVTYMSF